MTLTGVRSNFRISGFKAGIELGLTKKPKNIT